MAKQDLNVWKGARVKVYLDHGFMLPDQQPQDGDAPAEDLMIAITGLFCNYDGEFVYLNHHDNEPSTCTLSIRKDKIIMIELASDNDGIPSSENQTLN